MSNNLQANSLISNSNNYFLSEPIELSKKDYKDLKVGSWLKIEQNSFNILINNKDKYIYAKVFNKDGYLLIKKSKQKIKKAKKDSQYFSIKYTLDKELINTIMVLTKFPIKAVLLKGKKDYAYIELYIQDSIYIEIKELI